MPHSEAALDVTRVDGPHTPERTVGAAQLIADAVRYLNYASMPHAGAPGISYAGDVDGVLGAIQGAAHGLQQTLGQLEQCLRDDVATGRSRLVAWKPFADDPAKAVEVASIDLKAATEACAFLGAALGRARSITSAMYLTRGDPDGGAVSDLDESLKAADRRLAAAREAAARDAEAAGLTDLDADQLDGLACVHCRRTTRAMVPLEGFYGGRQLFVCADAIACAAAAEQVPSRA